MEFLRSLLRRRFARAQVATSRNVGRFLRLQPNEFNIVTVMGGKFYGEQTSLNTTHRLPTKKKLINKRSEGSYRFPLAPDIDYLSRRVSSQRNVG